MMINTSDAGKELGIHPANIVLRMAMMGCDFSDCWPQTDSGLVETIRTMVFRPDVANKSNYGIKGKSDGAAASQSSVLTRPATQIRILEKLFRKQQWGGNVVSIRTIQNNYCHGIHDVEESVALLLRDGFLISDRERRETYSLNADRRRDIELLVNGV